MPTNLIWAPVCNKVNWLLNVTINDISIIHVTLLGRSGN